MKKPLRVLFLCTGNSARSQIGEALLRHLSRGRIEVFSAGSQPRAEIHPLARQAVKDLFGLDMAGQYPKTLDQFLGQRLDYLISVCDRADASCPIFPGDTERIRRQPATCRPDPHLDVFAGRGVSCRAGLSRMPLDRSRTTAYGIS